MLFYHQWGPVTIIRGQHHERYLIKVNLKITYLKFTSNLPGANELTTITPNTIIFFPLMAFRPQLVTSVAVAVPPCMMTSSNLWKHFPRNWPFVRRIRRFPMNSSHKGQWRGTLMFSLICIWINRWVNNREAGDLKRYRAHYDVTVMVRYYAPPNGPLMVRFVRRSAIGNRKPSTFCNFLSAVFDAATNDLGGLHILVNNAGIGEKLGAEKCFQVNMVSLTSGPLLIKI